MRPSVKRSLTGVLIAGALVFSAVGVKRWAVAMARMPSSALSTVDSSLTTLQPYNYNSQPYNYSPQPYNYSPRGGAFQANTSHRFGHVRRHGQGGHGGPGYEGGYYGGY